MIVRALIPAVVIFAIAGLPAAAQVDLDSLVRQVHQSGCADALSALVSLAAGTDLEARRASFLAGWCLARLGRHAAAAAAYRAAGEHPTLAHHARVEEGLALLNAGSPADAVIRLRNAATPAPERLRLRALGALASAEMTLGRPAIAVQILTAAAELRSAGPDAWLRLGEAAQAAGRTGLARRALARAAWAHPGDAVEAIARDALTRLLGRPVMPADIPLEFRLERGKRLALQGEWDQAAVELRAVASGSRAAGLGGQAWYRLGEIWMLSDLRASYDAFRRAAVSGWNVAGAYYWMASAARRRGRTAEARQAIAALLRVAPSGFWAGRHWLGTGLRAEADGRFADAGAAYRRVIAAVPDSFDAAEARWRLGWIALQARRLSDAEARFREAAQAAPSRGDAARAWYWVAKTLETRGNAGAESVMRLVAERFPLTFYGHRARTRLGLPAPLLPPPLPRAVPRETAGPAHEELARLGLDADAVAAAEDAMAAKRELRVVRFLAEVYARQGAVRQSVVYAEEALRSGLRDEGLWRLAYPRAYWPEVGAASAAANIDPLLLLALVREESRYDPAIISPARAVGLAQLLPTTARALGGDPSIDVQRLKDPALNLRLGAQYVRLQLDRFNGDLRLALAAYNAGPGAARRWVALDPDPDYFVEKIGFAETRAYVRRVLGSYGIYRLLW